VSSRPIASPPRWRDDINPLFILIVVLGVVGALILTAGGIEFVAFEPLQHSGMTARVQGVYRYDPKSDRTTGSSSTRFTEDQSFAAVVDWKSVPQSTLVGAHWFNGFGEDVGSVGPETAGNLAASHQNIVPAGVPRGLDKNLPGHYLFVVERYVNGSPVEVIGRVIVLVQRG
jgi:hypothetical protein